MLKLFYAHTIPSLKVIFFLEEAKIPYKSFPINVVKKQNYNEEYQKIVPTKKTPSLIDGDKVFFDSSNILLHLAEKEDKFLPKESKNEVLSWFFWGATELNSKLFNYIYLLIDKENSDENFIEINKSQLNTLLQLIEKQLENKDYIAGKDFSIADINIYTSLKITTISKRINLPNILENFLNIQKWIAKIDKRESTNKIIKISTDFNTEQTITNEEIINFIKS